MPGGVRSAARDEAREADVVTCAASQRAHTMMAACVTDRLGEVADMVNTIEAWENTPQ
jgi:hypothetical protein